MKPKSNYINQEQLQQIIDYIPMLHIRKWKDVDVEYSMKIAYWGALRYGAEVADLTKEDFDLDRCEVYLGRTKTRKEDYAPIAAPFIPELRRYLATKAPLEPILKACDAQNMYKWLLKAGEALKIEALITPQSITGEKTKLHIFRKSIGKDIVFGTHGRQGNVYHAQSQLRHANPITTGKYLRLDIEGSKEFWQQPRQDKLLE